MEKYNYHEAVKADITEWLEEHGEMYTSEDGTISERAESDINEALWVTDSVTGNASGSYTFNTWQAEENLCHNLDLLGEALSEFGGGVCELVEKGAEWADVTIRCWLMGQVLGECIEEYNEKHEKTEAEEN